MVPWTGTDYNPNPTPIPRRTKIAVSASRNCCNGMRDCTRNGTRQPLYANGETCTAAPESPFGGHVLVWSSSAIKGRAARDVPSRQGYAASDVPPATCRQGRAARGVPPAT